MEKDTNKSSRCLPTLDLRCNEPHWQFSLKNVLNEKSKWVLANCNNAPWFNTSQSISISWQSTCFKMCLRMSSSVNSPVCFLKNYETKPMLRFPLNSLWPSQVRQVSGGLILAQVMVGCLTELTEDITWSSVNLSSLKSSGTHINTPLVLIPTQLLNCIWKYMFWLLYFVPMSSHLECVESHVLNLNFIQSINFIIHKKINILKVLSMIISLFFIPKVP